MQYGGGLEAKEAFGGGVLRKKSGESCSIQVDFRPGKVGMCIEREGERGRGGGLASGIPLGGVLGGRLDREGRRVGLGGGLGVQEGGGSCSIRASLSSSQVQLCSSAPAHALQERRLWAAQPLARDAAVAVVDLTQPQSQHITTHRTGIQHNFSGRQAEQHELLHSLAVEDQRRGEGRLVCVLGRGRSCGAFGWPGSLTRALGGRDGRVRE